MESYSRDERPEDLSDRQYEIYLAVAFQVQIPDWPRSLLNSFGTETQTSGTARGYVAQWIRSNPLDEIEKQVAITLETAKQKAGKS